MSQRIVVALGGNALGKNLHEQYIAVRVTARSIADLVEQGYEVVIAHGNGPQVGMIQEAMLQLLHADSVRYDSTPLSVCVAMSQGYVGYDLQNAFREEFLDRGLDVGAATVLTQVECDPNDPAFANPTKPIGPFMTEEEAKQYAAERGCAVAEDAGRGWRQVVASPRPIGIIELGTITSLVDTKHVVIACGGGGIPVIRTSGNHLKGAAAVIDKDFAAAKLAEQLDAQLLLILTAVEQVAINFGQPNQVWLDELGPEEVERYTAEGQFAAGSMLPKVQASLEFAQSGPGRKAIITKLERAGDGLAGRTGTVVHA